MVPMVRLVYQYVANWIMYTSLKLCKVILLDFLHLLIIKLQRIESSILLSSSDKKG
jgi:hypothetical protein